MGRKGFTLVEIMIVVAIIALLAAIAIPNLLRARVAANETAAMAGLSSLGTACETYAGANNGQYPATSGSLMSATPPYLNWDYCVSARHGYVYTCTMATIGYTMTAGPQNQGVTGDRSFTITTGGVTSW